MPQTKTNPAQRHRPLNDTAVLYLRYIIHGNACICTCMCYLRNMIQMRASLRARMYGINQSGFLGGGGDGVEEDRGRMSPGSAGGGMMMLLL